MVQELFAVLQRYWRGGMLAAATGEVESGLLASQAYNGAARVGPRTPVRPGERVMFGVSPERWHFFDPDTGLAIR